VKSGKNRVDLLGTRENHELNEVRNSMLRCQVVHFKFIIISNSIKKVQIKVFSAYFMLSSNSNILTFEFKVNLIYLKFIYACINSWCNYCVIAEGIDVVQCQKKVASSRTSHVTYAAYVVQCQGKVVSSRTSSRNLDRVLNHINQMMFNVETSDLSAYLNWKLVL